MSMLGRGDFATPHGGFASAIGVDLRRLYRVSAGLSDMEAAMLEPASVAVHAVRRTGLRLGDGVLVLGAGPIGLLAMQCAKAVGAGRLVVVEPNAMRRKQALLLGANAVIGL